MEEPPDPHYRCVKTSLKSVVKDDLVIAKQIDAARQANGIMIHTLQLLKLYLLQCCEEGLELPTLDREFVSSVMKVLCKSPSQGRPPHAKTKRIKETPKAFYKAYVSKELNYLSTDVITMYENNIKQKYVERVKDDLLGSHLPKTSHPLRHAWIDEQQHLVLPARDPKKDNVRYDIQCSPPGYLPCMLRMMRAVEAHDASVKNACSLRSNVVSKHIRIDMMTLIYLCFTKEQGKRSNYTTRGNLVKRQDNIWDISFKTDMKGFRAQGYTFDHQIESDGVACSIILKREGLVGKRKIQAKKGNNETYIDYEPPEGQEARRDRSNINDLLCCIDGDTQQQITFQYTQAMRRKETKAKKYWDYLQERKQEVIDGMRVIEWEAELSAYNRKTTDLEHFKVYVKKNNDMNRRLRPLYNYIFQMLKLGGYTRHQMMEARLRKRFKKLFGSGT